MNHHLSRRQDHDEDWEHIQVGRFFVYKFMSMLYISNERTTQPAMVTSCFEAVSYEYQRFRRHGRRRTVYYWRISIETDTGLLFSQ